MARILVVGSANVDIVVTTSRLPTPGETVTGGTLLVNDGGKGANQAVAACRLGAQVRFIGCVGDDTFGTAMCQRLAAQGLGIAGLSVVPGASTGTGMIMVDAAGRNQIAVASEANQLLTTELVAQRLEDFTWAQMVICQLENPLETVLWTLQTARQHGVITILNPAPAQPVPAAIWPLVDYLTPNEVEAAQLTSLPLTTVAEAAAVAQALLARGPRVVIITLGERGAYVCSPTEQQQVPAFPVSAVDTTAAGDAFNGALAVALAEGCPLTRAVRFANAAAALTCTRSGAQNALPARAAVDSLLASS
jgi:ribokinase